MDTVRPPFCIDRAPEIDLKTAASNCIHLFQNKIKFFRKYKFFFCQMTDLSFICLKTLHNQIVCKIQDHSSFFSGSWWDGSITGPFMCFSMYLCTQCKFCPWHKRGDFLSHRGVTLTAGHSQPEHFSFSMNSLQLVTCVLFFLSGVPTAPTKADSVQCHTSTLEQRSLRNDLFTSTKTVRDRGLHGRGYWQRHIHSVIARYVTKSN